MTKLSLTPSGIEIVHHPALYPRIPTFPIERKLWACIRGQVHSFWCILRGLGILDIVLFRRVGKIDTWSTQSNLELMYFDAEAFSKIILFDMFKAGWRTTRPDRQADIRMLSLFVSCNRYWCLNNWTFCRIWKHLTTNWKYWLASSLRCRAGSEKASEWLSYCGHVFSCYVFGMFLTFLFHATYKLCPSCTLSTLTALLPCSTARLCIFTLVAIGAGRSAFFRKIWEIRET